MLFTRKSSPRAGQALSGPAEAVPHRSAAAGALIELHDVVKTYEVGLTTLTVLNHIDLVVRAGRICQHPGPVRLGQVHAPQYGGRDRQTLPAARSGRGGATHPTLDEDRLARWRGRYVGVVFQFFQLLPTLTILENVILPMDFLRRLSPAEREQKVALHLLEAGGAGVIRLTSCPSTLSGGEQQRVAIARALANDPPLIVADEPTGNLDTGTSSTMFALFERLVQQGKTLFVVTHDLDLSARTQRVIRLVDGSIRQDETVRQRLASPTAPPGREHARREVTHEPRPESGKPGGQSASSGSRLSNGLPSEGPLYHPSRRRQAQGLARSLAEPAAHSDGGTIHGRWRVCLGSGLRVGRGHQR